MTAAWLTAGATVAYALIALVTAIYIATQVREAQRSRDAGVLKDAYDYIIRTAPDRLTVYRHEDAIRRIATIKELEAFERRYPEVSQAIHSVTNCYHYIGFLVENKVLRAKKAVLIEGGHTLLRIDEIVRRVIEIQRSRISPGYKRYFDALVTAARELDRVGS